MRYLVSFTFAMMLIIAAGCSRNKPVNSVPVPPRTPQTGRISVQNNSLVSIMISGYSQVRGNQRNQIQLYVHLLPGQNFYLHNIIDPGQSQLFPGGDQISMQYWADAPDPSNPSDPLFHDTVQLTVDGNLIIQVKSGGDYGISPG